MSVLTIRRIPAARRVLVLSAAALAALDLVVKIAVAQTLGHGSHGTALAALPTVKNRLVVPA